MTLVAEWGACAITETLASAAGTSFPLNQMYSPDFILCLRSASTVYQVYHVYRVYFHSTLGVRSFRPGRPGRPGRPRRRLSSRKKQPPPSVGDESGLRGTTPVDSATLNHALRLGSGHAPLGQVLPVALP